MKTMKNVSKSFLIPSPNCIKTQHLDYIACHKETNKRYSYKNFILQIKIVLTKYFCQFVFIVNFKRSPKNVIFIETLNLSSYFSIHMNTYVQFKQLHNILQNENKTYKKWQTQKRYLDTKFNSISKKQWHIYRNETGMVN